MNVRSIITPTTHEKAEWARMAQSAYRAGLTDAGHVYSVAAAMPNGTTLYPEQFDKLQTGYRRWLVFGLFS